jgi:hypothetical protein
MDYEEMDVLKERNHCVGNCHEWEWNERLVQMGWDLKLLPDMRIVMRQRVRIRDRMSASC